MCVCVCVGGGGGGGGGRWRGRDTMEKERESNAMGSPHKNAWKTHERFQLYGVCTIYMYI